MDIDVIPTLIEQFCETFEGEVTPGWCWITDGRPDAAIFGTIEPLSPGQAFAAPTPGAKSIAAHVAHLRYSLDLTAERLVGKNPPTDWPASFNVPDTSAEAWQSLVADLKRAYQAVLAILQTQEPTPLADWPPIHLAGLAAMTAHNAYHLGAIRQMVRAVGNLSRRSSTTADS
jgi:hypothetical protein